MSEDLKVAHINDAPKPKPKSIVVQLKKFINLKYNLRKNIISRNIEIEGEPIDDTMLNSIFLACKTEYSKATKDLVTAIIFSEFIQPYNPFSEILNHYCEYPPKIKTGHISKLISSIETDTENADLFIKKWLVALIASINYKHSPLMLVLCGPQNTGKTEWFRRLLPESLSKYYAESKLDLGKDDEILMTKKLIIMDDEMGGKSKQEQKKLKEMTSKQTFSIRAPYGRISEDLKRLAMLCGTTNDEEILNDPTGNRRILPVRVLSVDFNLYNSVNKDLAFYEAWMEYEKGFDYNLSKDEILLLTESTSHFKQSSTEEELVLYYYGKPEDYPQQPQKEVTNSEIISHIQAKCNARLSQTKLGLVLKQLGFEQKHIKIMNTTKRVYVVHER